MKQVFATHPLATASIGLVALVVIGPIGSAEAAPIRGVIKMAAHVDRSEQLGFTHTRVTSASEVRATLTQAVALFLKVNESLPIPKPEITAKIELTGLQLVPNIATCAVDSKMQIVNSESSAVTLQVGTDSVRLEAGATHEYECTVGEPDRRVRVKEWPHVRGLIYVGEVGVAAMPEANGSFRMLAPDGKYELLIVSRDGVVTTLPVEVSGSSVNLKTIDLTAAADDGQPGSEAP